MDNGRFTKRRNIIFGIGAAALSLGLSNACQREAEVKQIVVPAELTNPTMAELAIAFLQTLNPEQRQQAVFPFESEERFNWHYVPRRREGISFKEMNAEQKAAANELLRFATNEMGYRKVTDILRLEDVLRQMGGNPAIRDPELYFFTVFADPTTTPWGWRVEGHHLSLNFAVITDDIVTITPAFLGSNPAEVLTSPHQGLRAMSQEQDLARELVRSLDATQLERAIIASQSFGDILTGPLRNESLTQPIGLPLSEMDDGRRGLAMRLIEAYVRTLRGEFADAQMQRIRDGGVDYIHFAWAGGLNSGQAHYYRLHGQSLLIEYDNTQNNANHIHSVLRDPTSDFGVDLLCAHYEQKIHSHHYLD